MDTKAQDKTNKYIQELKDIKEEIEDMEIQIEYWTHSLTGNHFSRINSQICRNQIKGLESDKKTTNRKEG